MVPEIVDNHDWAPLNSAAVYTRSSSSGGAGLLSAYAAEAVESTVAAKRTYYNDVAMNDGIKIIKCSTTAVV